VRRDRKRKSVSANTLRSGGNRISQGAPRSRRKLETPKASRGRGEWEGSIPHPSRLYGLGSVVSSPSGVRGRSPGRKRF